MSFTVLATPRSFAKNDDAPIRLLEEQGCTVIRLPMNGGDLQAQLLEQLPQADAVSLVWSPTPAPCWRRPKI